MCDISNLQIVSDLCQNQANGTGELLKIIQCVMQQSQTYSPPIRTVREYNLNGTGDIDYARYWTPIFSWYEFISYLKRWSCLVVGFRSLHATKTTVAKSELSYSLTGRLIHRLKSLFKERDGNNGVTKWTGLFARARLTRLLYNRPSM